MSTSREGGDVSFPTDGGGSEEATFLFPFVPVGTFGRKGGGGGCQLATFNYLYPFPREDGEVDVPLEAHHEVAWEVAILREV